MNDKKTKRRRTPGAVRKCWELFQGLPREVSRKEALALCAVHGINLNTAKTHWQKFIEKTDRERWATGRPDPLSTPADPANPAL